MNYIEAFILAVVEGITEFLPVSSTGHMVASSTLMGIAHDDFTKLFTIVIQFGAILSVIVLYWKKFFQSINFYLKLFVGFIPAAIFGVLFSDQIDAMLENAIIVGIMLIIGGVFFLFVDKLFEKTQVDDNLPGYKKSFIIGFFQCIAMIPGVSRSAATIIGGLSQKMTRKAAAEFSFFLAVPTMFAATTKKLYDFYQDGIMMNAEQVKILAFGNIVAFIVAIIAIKSFITFLTKHGFKLFGYYRIIAGILILVMVMFGFQLKF
ncbi:MAG TPA: undecaprenyl-diphosphate phosphatase [Bacteroidales bacterium]|nr:undecaprenyl-diphosphate phosphatase [Bacteroidales bacterium]